MATTTNYGWTTPDDTALVKDGASAIRSLGSSIDTTTKALNPETTLGDISYRSSTANTNTRLAIGTTGQVLTVNGGVPSWQNASSGGMTLISTTTLSGSSTTISSIPQTYESLFFLLTGVTMNGNYRIYGQPNETALKCDYCLAYSSTYFSYVNEDMYLEVQNSTGSNTNNCIALRIDNYTQSTLKPFTYHSRYVNDGGTNTPAWGAGGLNITSALTSFKFVSSSGSFTAGTVKLYGVK